MGCTSSAPNMAESPTSTTDGVVANLQSSEDSRERIKGTENIYSNGHSELEQTQVLPECEIRNNQTHLDRNNSPPATDKIESDVDTADNQHTAPTAENDHTVHLAASNKSEESFISLKEVVDKMISDNTGEDIQMTSLVEETKNVDLDRQIDEIVKESSGTDGVDEIETNDDTDNVKESTSPAQSEDSRATRWEALADIAAELPPSLAVDPITGQIYSLTK
ncbi:uncharacterized protein [Epargyreus clarus]|uniref:uncharacterized protein n=1 Tax=Epargyreus clarus TaxID=520877 RepID=UPI003C2FD756